MKKPKYGMTLGTAQSILAKIARGETMLDPCAECRAKEVVRYWEIQKAKRSVAKGSK